MVATFVRILIIIAIIGAIGYALLGWSGAIIFVVLIALPISIAMYCKKKDEIEVKQAKLIREEAERKAREQARLDRLVREQQIRAEALAYEKEQQEKEAQRKAAAAEALARQEQAYLAELDAIPAAEIELSTEKYKRRPLRDMPEVKFTNITKRTNPLTLTSYVVVDVETTGIPRTSDEDTDPEYYDVYDYKLGTLCEYYGIRLARAHRACADCLATGRLFAELAKERMQ